VKITVQRLPQAARVGFEAEHLVVELRDGRSLRVPLAWFPWLRRAADHERYGWELVADGLGINWPMLNQDLFVLDLLVPQEQETGP
jgi:hypothetical protein